MPAPSLVPFPRSARSGVDASFPLSGATIGGDQDAATELARLLSARTGETPAIARSGSIRLDIGGNGGPESYVLTVDAASVSIVGADPAGLFYGVQTLAQLVTEIDGSWMLPPAEIADAPRFAYRGAMLDVARHFFPVSVVCTVIDRIAALKLNHLHLHLTDDQGWRLEFASRPELTARGAGSEIGGGPGGFYTRDDYARIIAYAAARHVTVVPEIDVPGHTHAVGLAHPELVEPPAISDDVRDAAERFGGGLPTAGAPYTGFAVGFSSLRLADEATYAFLADVFGELAELTPGPYLHLGGDEAHATPRAAYAEAIRRTVDIVASTGKTPIAWHEAGSVTGLATDVVAQYWGLVDGDPHHRAAASGAASVILSPADAAYLDQKPEPGYRLGLEWAAGPVSLERAYAWEPADVLGDVDVLGVEAALWTETVQLPDDIDALMFPRIAAAAEIAWSPAPSASAERTWASFRARVATLAPLWAAAGIRPGPDGLAGGDAGPDGPAGGRSGPDGLAGGDA